MNTEQLRQEAEKQLDKRILTFPGTDEMPSEAIRTNVLIAMEKLATSPAAKEYWQQQSENKLLGALMSGLQYGYALDNSVPFVDHIANGKYAELCKIWEVTPSPQPSEQMREALEKIMKIQKEHGLYDDLLIMHNKQSEKQITPELQDAIEFATSALSGSNDVTNDEHFDGRMGHDTTYG